MAAVTTAAMSAREKKDMREVVQGLVNLVMDDEFPAALLLMRSFCTLAEKDTTSADSDPADESVSVDTDALTIEWDRKCAEAVKNGAVLMGEKGTNTHSINYLDSDQQLHRKDGPAHEGKDGCTLWKVHGKFHRIGGPAEEWPGHHMAYLHDGSLHREDGPAIVYSSGLETYHLNGVEVRNLPTVHGKEWDLKCLKAHLKGAEINSDGVIVYSKFDLTHNESGPAIERPDGTQEIWIHGKRLAVVKPDTT